MNDRRKKWMLLPECLGRRKLESVQEADSFPVHPHKKIKNKNHIELKYILLAGLWICNIISVNSYHIYIQY